ncbi:dihydroxyacetone kinase family protein [uncultured Olegusella sp.]|uniref:dihydroxyacetone kinase family protein n=1 Tax=uncultured Olegusella sp. TaxID=1979846 RepID=UPI002611A0DB|nr:dihydroxyacetone kinase family protein [uncultured Olegusella sp.]
MLYNDPKTFREDMLKGYEAAYPEYIVQVPGGVARATEMPEDKVAIINGGGSGHYPAFCGIVGDGFMDATVVGNVFTSPSTDDVLQVAKSVEHGTGIFILGGNYAGDKMNFNLARDALREEGIDARTFFITDDVAAAKPEEWEKRRGNVGTFTVFKSVGAAAAEGKGLDELERVAKLSNDRVRTMSIGFRGCTLPGESAPLFNVPAGKMEIGQGIHGEPGVGEADLASAVEVAELLVDRVLAEAPADDNKRIAVILDGLGSTKYEELFVVWGTVRELLEERGYTLVEPLVGEFVTSLDMEGIALSVEFLTDELERYWKAPASTPAFRKGASEGLSGARREYVAVVNASKSYAAGSEASRAAASYIVDAFDRVKAAIAEAEPELAKIDGVAGDGDHGRGMVKGTTFAAEAASEAYDAGAAAGSVLIEAGKAWASKAGGTSGVLWGEALEAAGKVVGDNADSYDATIAAAATKAAYERMLELGGAHRGDKTMLDTLIPFAEALEAEAQDGSSLADAWARASELANQAAKDTAQLVPKVGRARPAAERSLGTPDAGAVSMALVIRTVM